MSDRLSSSSGPGASILTGIFTESAARTALGLGTISTQDASAVAITGGTIASVAITGGTATSLAITGGTISGATISAGTLVGMAASGGTITGAAISSSTINGWSTTFAVLDTSANNAPAAGGNGFAVNDLITCANGVVLAVTGQSAGQITTYIVSSRGSATSVPANPVAMVSTTGGGSGATFNLNWGPIAATIAFANENTPGDNGGQILGAQAGIGLKTTLLGPVAYGPGTAGSGLNNADGLGGGTGMTNAESTFIGYNCGTQVVNGLWLTYIGHHAGGHEVNGSHQVAIGTDAYKWGVGGTSIVAIGSDAMKFLQAPQTTIAIGESAAAGVFNNPLIVAIANNGSGLIRVQVASTGTMATGDKAYVTGAASNTNANGAWTITLIDSTHVDLQGSAFAVSGGAAGVITTFGTLALANTVAIGYSVLGGNSLRSVGRHVAIGTQALANLTIATDVVAIGHNVCAALTSGSQSVYVGSQAGATPTNGAGHVVIGYNANLNATNSANSVVIGGTNTGGGRGAQGGDGSVVIGAIAGGTSGLTNSVVLGAFAGQNATGSNVTLLGRSVGGTTLTTGTNVVYIGTNSSIDAATGSESNVIRIGAGSTGVIIATGCGTPANSNVLTAGSLSVSGQTTTITAGSGAPASTQPNGSLYMRTDGTSGSRLYVSAGGGTWAAAA